MPFVQEWRSKQKRKRELSDRLIKEGKFRNEDLPLLFPPGITIMLNKPSSHRWDATILSDDVSSVRLRVQTYGGAMRESVSRAYAAKQAEMERQKFLCEQIEFKS